MAVPPTRWNPFVPPILAPPSPSGGVSTQAAPVVAAGSARGTLVLSFAPTVSASETNGGSELDEQILFSGSVIGLSVRGATKTAGAATFTAFVAAQATGMSVIWPTGVSRYYQTFAAGTFSFAAGDDLGPRWTTNAAFLPSGGTVDIRLYCSLSG